MPITFEKVSYVYQANTPFESQALFGVDLNIEKGQYVAIVGHTGSGKSTLVQHLNALVKPTSGTVYIDEKIITRETNNKNLKPLRKKVGIVFQFPEAQLFDETVLKDISFGPMNFGVTREEAEKIAREKLKLVGLEEELLARSPFDLSGGQMRRVAIAGVLAMNPEVLVLDEPTAGLDPKGRREMMEMFKRLHEELGLTIVLVTHLMDDVSHYADFMYLLAEGKIVKKGIPREVFQEVEWLTKMQIGVPQATKFAYRLVQQGFEFSQLPMNELELAQSLLPQLKAGEEK